MGANPEIVSAAVLVIGDEILSGKVVDENARFLWNMLPPHFATAELDAALAELAGQHVTRRSSAVLAERARWMAASSYSVEFDELSALSERVLWPASPAESRGMIFFQRTGEIS